MYLRVTYVIYHIVYVCSHICLCAYVCEYEYDYEICNVIICAGILYVKTSNVHAHLCIHLCL